MVGTTIDDIFFLGWAELDFRTFHSSWLSWACTTFPPPFSSIETTLSLKQNYEPPQKQTQYYTSYHHKLHEIISSSLASCGSLIGHFASAQPRLVCLIAIPLANITDGGDLGDPGTGNSGTDSFEGRWPPKSALVMVIWLRHTTRWYALLHSVETQVSSRLLLYTSMYRLVPSQGEHLFFLAS